MLNDVAMTIVEDATGANGDLTREERITSAQRSLVDFVYECLGCDDIGFGTVIDHHVYRSIERMVAVAMLAQHKHDEEGWRELVGGIVEANPNIDLSLPQS
jgi:hypothetical protein